LLRWNSDADADADADTNADAVSAMLVSDVRRWKAPERGEHARV
jgi:hypothetical protein